MQIIIKGNQLDLSESLKSYAKEKLGTLERFIQKFESEGEQELSVEVLRTTRHHHKGDVYQANVALKLPDKVLKASSEHEDIHAALDGCKDQLKLEIEKYRTKKIDKKRHVKS